MANKGDSLLDLDDSKWLEDDTNLSTKPADMSAQAYIPPDDFAVESEVQTQPNVTTRSTNDDVPHVPNNFDGGLLSLNHYRRYFNLNTTEFFQHCLSSVNFLQKVEVSDDAGDMYGPLWVTATVIFILFFSNTCSGLLVSWIKGDDSTYKYNFGLLTGAISLLYGYTFIIPLIYYFLTSWYLKLAGLLPLSKVISIYGYANASWVPAAILSIARGFLVNHAILSNTLKWVSVLLGGVISGASILVKLYPVNKNSCLAVGNEKLAIILCAGLLIAHIGLIIAVKVSFFGDLSVV